MAYEAGATLNNLTLCSSCGIPAVNHATWKKCDCSRGGCGRVKYCSDECKAWHSNTHKEELRTKKLFTQPEKNQLGECPICCLPLSNDMNRSIMMGCCNKIICDGCSYANKKREIEQRLRHRCAFCREPLPKTPEEGVKRDLMKRVKADDPMALWYSGKRHQMDGSYEAAFDHLTRAAELGVAAAHRALSGMYYDGQGVTKDMKMSIYYAEQAAMLGCPDSRYDLGVYDVKKGKYDKAKKHFIMLANIGYDGSLKWLKELYVDGKASKEDYADALRAYQAAVNAAKSREREVANSLYNKARGAARKKS